MIIVSQDKRSIINFEKVNVININKSDLREIGAYFNCDEEKTLDNILLGKYETEERAKEVLKDILLRYEAIELCKYKSSDELGYTLGDYTPIYEMPLE